MKKVSHIRRLLFAALVMLLSLPSFAEWQPIVRNFTPQEYAGGTQNWRMLQSESGWLYAANSYGLLVYDGSNWTLYGVWNSSAIHSMAPGPDGMLYVGCSNDFGVFSGNRSGDMVYRSLADSVPASYRNFGEVWQVSYDEDIIYVQTRNYIFVCTPSGHVEVVDPACIIYASLVQDHCLYLSTSNGVYLYSGNRLHTLQGSNLLNSLIVSAMAPLSDHEILIATDFSGVFVYDGSSIHPFATAADDFLRRNQLYSLAVGKQSIAFGTVLNGLAVTDLDGRNVRYINRNQGMQNNTVLSLAFDAEDNLWCGLDQGIDLLLLQSPLQFLRSPQVEYGAGYAYAERGGYRYYGTNQGLYCSTSGSDDLSLVAGSLGQVWNLCLVGDALFCCHNRGLFLLDGKSLTRLDIPDGVWNVLPLSGRASDSVGTPAPSAAQQALACTYSGLYLLRNEGGHYRPVRRIRGYDETVLYAQLDAFSRLWTITSRGVECMTFDEEFTRVKRTVVLPDETRNRYSLSRLGNRVVISGEGYLATVRAKDGSLSEDDALAARLAGKHKYPVLKQDAAGNLIFLLDGRLSIRHYDRVKKTYAAALQEVFSDKNFFIGGFANLAFRKDGHAVLGGVDGFYLVDMARPDLEPAPSSVVFRRVESPEMGVVYGESGVVEQHEAIRLPANRYFLRVDYCGNHANRQGLMFQTRLLPVEKDFSDWSDQPYCNLTLPKHGHYTLEVRMHTTDAEDAVSSLDIYVAAPWYIRWWAWLLYAVLLALLVAAVVWYVHLRLSNTRRRIAAEKEKEIHEQEMRILQLEHEQSQFDLKTKSRELNSVLLNQVNRNELSASLQEDVHRVSELLDSGDQEAAQRVLRQLEGRLSAGMHPDKDWKRFEENFDFVNDRFIRRLSARFPWMNKQEKKLCIYIYMGLQTKEIAPLLNLSTRGVEMMRYRVRKKMNLDAQANMKHYFEDMLSEEE